MRYTKALTRMAAIAGFVGVVAASAGGSSYAEGTYQFNDKQGLTNATVVYADVLKCWRSHKNIGVF